MPNSPEVPRDWRDPKIEWLAKYLWLRGQPHNNNGYFRELWDRMESTPSGREIRDVFRSEAMVVIDNLDSFTSMNPATREDTDGR